MSELIAIWTCNKCQHDVLATFDEDAQELTIQCNCQQLIVMGLPGAPRQTLEEFVADVRTIERLRHESDN